MAEKMRNNKNVRLTIIGMFIILLTLFICGYFGIYQFICKPWLQILASSSPYEELKISWTVIAKSFGGFAIIIYCYFFYLIGKYLITYDKIEDEQIED